MTAEAAHSALITAALVVAGIRLWLQVRGKAKSPFSEWAIGWGATFFVLALLAEASPTAAGSLALVVLVSDFLRNAINLTSDVSGLVTGTEGSSTIFTESPFASGTAQTGRSQSPRENTTVSNAGLGHQNLS